MASPDLWRRYLALMVDGLRVEGSHELPVPPLAVEDFPAIMAEVREAAEGRGE